jgi:hypothetical protein
MTDNDDAANQATSSIPDHETSADWQDGSGSDAVGSEGPKDLGSTSEGFGLTAGGTGTEINTEGDITKGGYAGDYGGEGDTVGGVSSQTIGTVGEGMPSKPKDPEES